MYEAWNEHARMLMTRNVVHLSNEARSIACRQMACAFAHHDIDVREIMVDAVHYHVVAQFPPELLDGIDAGSPGITIPGPLPNRTSARDDPPRHYVGIAKKRSAWALRNAKLVRPGGVWATRCRVVPVKSSAHLNWLSTQYLPGHVRHGGVLWSQQSAEAQGW